MPLFAPSPRDSGQLARGTSAPPQRPSATSPLAAPARPKTKTPRLPLSARRKPKKNAIHPIDRRDLETKLELICREPASPPAKATAHTASQGYTVSVSILHALDLHNPCLIRSCPHPFSPAITFSINNHPGKEFTAKRHAANYTSWSRDTRLDLEIRPDASTAICIVKAHVTAHCTRHPHQSAMVMIGSIDDIVLPVTGGQDMELAQFVHVFRHHIAGDQVIQYFAGKVKIQIRVAHKHKAPEPVSQTPKTPPLLLDRPKPLLPLNLGDALQLKRKQLKATVAPDTVNHATIKRDDDPEEASKLLRQLQELAAHQIIREQDVTVVRPIGEGIHAVVSHVRLQIGSAPVDAAMKEFRYNRSQSDTQPPPLSVLRAFHQEFIILTRLATATDPVDTNATVQLKGVMLSPRLALFTDFCSDGSLASCMRDGGQWSDVAFDTKLEMARQIAAALASLHQRRIAHRDIKPHNIMIHGLTTLHPLAKIGDLGSAIVMEELPLREETGSSGYTAPEVFSATGYDHRADIWSLGVVLWELWTTNTKNARALVNPFHGLSGDAVVHTAESGQRPELPSGHAALPDWLASLLRRCWLIDPALRPYAEEVAEILAHHSSNTV